MRILTLLLRKRMAALLLCGLIVLAYFPLIGKVTFSPDAHIILPPLLETSALGYLKMLSSFEVVDFQPVRDLTFFFDIIFFRNFQIATFTLTNVLFWCLSCLLLFRLIRRVALPLSRVHIFLLVSAFAVYPLFSQAVGWTMARKHLVAVSLILLATHLFLDWMKGRRKWFAFYLAYVAAVLSHPIVVFWPCWAFLHHKFFHRGKAPGEKKIYSVTLVTMVVLLLTNYAYYVVLSPRLHEYYTQARPAFSLSRNLLHFVFYFRELIWPYQLSFTYYPDLASAWPGSIAILALGYFAWKKHRHSDVLSWILFALFPFPVFIGLSVYDQYLLVPATGILIAISVGIQEIRRTFLPIIAGAILVWCALTHIEASRWPVRGAISVRNFVSAPSCRSAIEAINSWSQVSKEMLPDAIEFFDTDHCNTVVAKLPPAEKPKALTAQALYLYYRKGSLSEEKVLEDLRSLGAIHYYPLLLYAVIMAEKENTEEVRAATDYIFERTQGPVEETGPLVTETLRPFCGEHALPHCLELISGRPGPAMPFF